MRKVFYCLFITSLLAFMGLESVQGQEVVKFKIADSFTIGHPSQQAMLRFIKRVEESIPGKVKIEYYPAEQLGKLKDLLTLCSNGMVDIVYVPPGYHAGVIPLNTIGMFPYYTTAVEGTQILNRLLGVCPEMGQEFLRYGVRPLTYISGGQWDIGTIRKPVRSPEDLKGLKLRTPGGLYDNIAKRYGIIAVNLPSPEMYESLQRGVVEGNLAPFPSVKAWRLNELLKYHTYGARMGGFPLIYTINEKTWQKTPDEIQKVLLAVATEYNKDLSGFLDQEQIRLVKEFEKMGMMIHPISEQDRAKWDAPLQGIEQEWIREMEKKGLAGKKVFDSFLKICREVAK